MELLWQILILLENVYAADVKTFFVSLHERRMYKDGKVSFTYCNLFSRII